MVCLKKLGIDIDTVVSVEHDPVAKAVFRHNNDSSYHPAGPADDDSITYVTEYSSFEELSANIEAIVKENGPFDIVIAGPPCQDYTKVNALAKGAEGSQGKYLVRLADLIKEVERFNQQHHDGFDELFFLVENVPGSENATDQYGVAEFVIDAALFGPCKRVRVFYTNISPDSIPEEEHPAGGTTCLDPTQPPYWMTGTMFAKGVDSKVFTLLGSKSRVMDDPMSKWRVLEEHRNATTGGEDRPASHGEWEFFCTADRERLMGLPPGYVGEPVKDLFHHLQAALKSGLFYGRTWSDELPPRYLNFLGLGPDGHGFKSDEGSDLEKDDFVNRVVLSLKTKNADAQMTEHEYAWHLIGNGYSIPQVMYLLKPLCPLFKQREYPGYTGSKFAWEDED